MRLAFLGTPEFAVPTLERLIADGHEIACVVTQPDRAKGRSQAAAPPPVKQAALRHGLAVYQPERIRRPEALAALAKLETEAMVVVGYGQIIPQAIIDLPRHGILNVHASLLPKYRGAAPIQWAIVRGETRTGVTIMRIDAGLDTGDMLLRQETEIDPNETAVELAARLAPMGADLMARTLARIGRITPEKQNEAEATYAPILTREHGAIDWSRAAAEVHNQVRGLQPWPGAWCEFRGQKLHIWRTRLAQSGGRRRMLARCGDGDLELVEVQLEGRKRMPAEAFANGQRITAEGVFHFDF
jgi:methionyl-tRNA formyltransferase